MTSVLIAGGQGRLGMALSVEFARRGCRVFPMSHQQMDVTSRTSVFSAMRKFEPTLTVNCAAVLSVESESDHAAAWKVNVCGAANLAREAIGRFVQISTDYVFSGEKGCPYVEHDPPDPVNYYGLTKAAGEAAVLAAHPFSLVLRAPFRYDGPWPYPKAFADQHMSGRWMRDVVPDIVTASLDRNLFGTLHIAGPRRSVFDMARESSPSVEPCDRADWIGMRIPRDTSLDSSLWSVIRERMPAQLATA